MLHFNFVSAVIPDSDKEASQAEERSTSPAPRNAPTEIWRGTINMIDVAQISITAHEVSGRCISHNRKVYFNRSYIIIFKVTTWRINEFRNSNLTLNALKVLI